MPHHTTEQQGWAGRLASEAPRGVTKLKQQRGWDRSKRRRQPCLHEAAASAAATTAPPEATPLQVQDMKTGQKEYEGEKTFQGHEKASPRTETSKMNELR